MKKEIFSNFIYQASYQILLIILPIITVPIVSDALGPEGIGTYNFVNSIVDYFILAATLGLANYGVREIALVREDKTLLSRKFWELVIFSMMSTAVTLICYFGFLLLIDNSFYFLISSISILSSAFDITWFYSGIENFKKITIRNFIIRIIGFLLIVLTIKDSNDLVLYFLINILSVLVSQISLWISLNKYIYWVKVSLRDCISHFKPAIRFFIAKIAVTVYQSSTKTILGFMTNMTLVGLYSNAYMLVLISSNIINAMNTIMIPRMSQMYGKDDEKGMIILLKKTVQLQLFFTIAMMFGINSISNHLVDWFFGPEFAQIKNILPWLSPVIIFQTFQMAIAAQYLIPKNEIKNYNISVIIGAVVTVVSTITFIPLLGVFGAVLGINAGYLTVSIIRIVFIYKDTDFRLDFNRILKWLIAGASMWFIIYLVTNNWPASIITTITQVFIGLTVYFVLTFLFKVNPITDLIKKD